MAIHRDLRIHQYLDDWLVRARSHQACPQHTQELVKMYQQLGWLVNLEKSELEPKQDFDFVGYQFDLRSGGVRLTPDRWQNLQEKMLKLLSLPACLVWEFMSLIGLLTGTEKQVHLGRLHMRPILQIPPGLSPTYTGTSKNVSATGLAGELREIRAGAQTKLRFCRLPV